MPLRQTYLSILTLSILMLVGMSLPAGAEESKLSALILDGQNNHNWQVTTPLIRANLESSGRFAVAIATSPARGEDMSSYAPKFSDYDVVVSNYNGADWPESTREAFVQYVRGGGGLVIVHAADNAFANWREYNQMQGLGGWGGRNQKSGPYVYIDKDGQVVRDDSQGRGGSHGPRHDFQVVIRQPNHPITRGLPRAWMHAKDELYGTLRGPGEQMTILATAFAPTEKKGRNVHEPMLMVIAFGEGRVFHTTLGHDEYAMSCIGHIVTLQRGTEWAATGEVTIPLPENFPTAHEIRRIGESTTP